MNRLAKSLSPYLLQHQNNPVDWYPWGEEAFDEAKRSDRPIFLSVGYAACHWCHVMEHESFENESIAAFLNEHFVSIKVDREERPDIDQIYMNAVQLMTRRGGWPMSVFLNHQLQPFYAGTYWPPAQKFGMPGFPQILEALADVWNTRRQDIDQQASEVTAALHQMAAGVAESASEVPDMSVVRNAIDELLQVLDHRDGGFGAAPKFPHATDLDLLLRQGRIADDPALISAATLTLDRMADGGIYDHVGGGFARYSVDAQWLVPHFEKMLYDNALLAEIYVRGFQVTSDPRYAEVACGVLDYLIREMVDESGGFHSSEDADSEGVEGKFYVWTVEQVIEVLGEERGNRFCQIYDITPAGNFEGKNIPHLSKSLHRWAKQLSISFEQLDLQLADDREQLRVHRMQRVPPGRDDKVLTSWNSLAIKALAVAGGVLDRSDYIDAAQRAALFLTGTMIQDDGRLLHAFRHGRAHLNAYLDDYAYAIEAFIALFESTGQARWIGHATKFADQILAKFLDRDSGGFFYTADDSESLITRNKDWHDGSLISGNAAAASGLLRLSMLCQRDDYREAAEKTLMSAGDVIRNQSMACSALVSVLDRYWNANEQMVMAVRDTDIAKAIRSRFLGPLQPHATLSWVIGDAPSSGPVVALNQYREPIDGKTSLYICHDFTCDKPLVGEEVDRWLSEQGSS